MAPPASVLRAALKPAMMTTMEPMASHHQLAMKLLMSMRNSVRPGRVMPSSRKIFSKAGTMAIMMKLRMPVAMVITAVG